MRAHKNVRSDFWGLKWKQSIFSLINSIVLATMHANLAILRATAAMQKGGEIDKIALSIYYAPSSAHPVCFFKHCNMSPSVKVFVKYIYNITIIPLYGEVLLWVLSLYKLILFCCPGYFIVIYITNFSVMFHPTQVWEGFSDIVQM